MGFCGVFPQRIKPLKGEKLKQEPETTYVTAYVTCHHAQAGNIHISDYTSAHNMS